MTLTESLQMYQIDYFGNGEYDNRKDIFKHGSKASP